MTERMNMLRIDAPASEKLSTLRFDPEHDVSERVWNEMLDALQRCDESNSIISGFPKLAGCLGIIRPDVVGRLSESAWRQFEAMIAQHRKDDDIKMLFEDVAWISLVDPVRAAKVTWLTDIEWQRIQEELETSRASGGLNFARIASNMTILGRKPLLHESDWQRMKASFLSTRLNDATEHAMRMKLLDPSRAPVLPDEHWIVQRDTLNYPDVDAVDLARIIACMKVLAAEEVNVTGKGLEIHMRKRDRQFAEGKPPLPELPQI